MSKITCSVINDLLPLYVDEVISADGSLIVEEHLEQCEFCAKELSKMKKPMIITPNSDKTRIKEMKRRVGNKRFIVVTLLMLVSLTVFALLGTLWIKVHFDSPYGAGVELANYFILSVLILLSFSAVWYWGVYTVYAIRKKLDKDMPVKKVCISSACTLLTLYCAAAAGFFLAFYGSMAACDDVQLQTKFQYSDNSYLNQEWVVHFTSNNNKALNVFRKETYNEQGIVTGIVYTVHEVPLKMMLASDNYTAGYSYGDISSAPTPGFDFTATIVFRDKTIVYSMRGEGLFEKQDI